ncbi:MAG: hypothetical protein ACTSV7_10130, partial [Candidatus Baldrarchaeia archaeon]
MSCGNGGIGESFGFEGLKLNREALKTDYLPENLLYRDEQLNMILREFEAVRLGFPPPNILLTGPPGSG